MSEIDSLREGTKGWLDFRRCAVAFVVRADLIKKRYFEGDVGLVNCQRHGKFPGIMRAVE